MSRIGITFNDVKTAILELQGRQKNPTVDAIREILGTGSKSTIARLLREWKTQHGLGGNSLDRLPSELLSLVNGLWDALQSKADEQITQAQHEYDSKEKQIQQQLTHARQIETQLRQSIHTLEESQHQKSADIQHLSAKLSEQSEENIRAAEKIVALETRLEEHHAENQRLHQLLKHVQSNLEHYQAATQKLREEQSLKMEKQQVEYEQRIAYLLTQANKADGEKADCLAKHEQLKHTHESLKDTHQKTSEQHTTLCRQHDILRAEQEKMQSEQDALKKQTHQQHLEMEALNRNLMELQFTLNAREEKIAILESTLSQSRDKVELLRQENQLAREEKSNMKGQLKQMQVMLSSKAQGVDKNQ